MPPQTPQGGTTPTPSAPPAPQPVSQTSVNYMNTQQTGTIPPAPPAYPHDQQMLLDTLQRSQNLSDNQRQSMWDAYTKPKSDAEFIQSMNQLQVGDDVRQSLWNMRKYGSYDKPVPPPAGQAPYLTEFKSRVNRGEDPAAVTKDLAQRGETDENTRQLDQNPGVMYKGLQTVLYGAQNTFIDPYATWADAQKQQQMQQSATQSPAVAAARTYYTGIMADSSKLAVSILADPKNWPFLAEGAAVNAGAQMSPVIKYGANALFSTMAGMGAVNAYKNNQWSDMALNAGFAALGLNGMDPRVKAHIVDEVQKMPAPGTPEAPTNGAIPPKADVQAPGEPIESPRESRLAPRSAQPRASVSNPDAQNIPIEIAPKPTPKPTSNGSMPRNEMVETMDGMQPTPRMVDADGTPIQPRTPYKTSGGPRPVSQPLESTTRALAQSTPVPQEVLRQGQGTSAAFVEQETKTNLDQRIASLKSEIGRLTSIVQNPKATPEEIAYSKQALVATNEQYAETLGPKSVPEPSQTNLDTLTPDQSDIAKTMENRAASNKTTAGVAPSATPYRRIVEQAGGKFRGMDSMGLVHFDVPPDRVGGREGVTVSVPASRMSPNFVEAQFARKAAEFSASVDPSAEVAQSAIAQNRQSPTPNPALAETPLNGWDTAKHPLYTQIDRAAQMKVDIDKLTDANTKRGLQTIYDRTMSDMRFRLSNEIQKSGTSRLSVMSSTLGNEATLDGARAQVFSDEVKRWRMNESAVANIRGALEARKTLVKVPTGEIDDEGQEINKITKSDFAVDSQGRPTKMVGRSARNILHELMGEKSVNKWEDFRWNDKPTPEEARSGVTAEALGDRNTRLAAERESLKRDVHNMIETAKSQSALGEHGAMGELIGGVQDEEGPLWDKLKQIEDIEKMGGSYALNTDSAPTGRKAIEKGVVDSKGILQPTEAPLLSMTLDRAQKAFGRKLRQIPEKTEFDDKAAYHTARRELNLQLKSMVGQALKPREAGELAIQNANDRIEGEVNPHIEGAHYVSTKIEDVPNSVGETQKNVVLQDGQGRPIGTAMLFGRMLDGKRMLETSISLIDKSEQGKGYGTQMYKDIIKHAQEYGMDGVMSDVDEQRTEPATKTWEKLKREGVPVEKVDNRYQVMFDKKVNIKDNPEAGKIGIGNLMRLGASSVGAMYGAHIGGIPGAMGGWTLGFLSPEMYGAIPFLHQNVMRMSQPLARLYNVSVRDWYEGPKQEASTLRSMDNINNAQQRSMNPTALTFMQRLGELPGKVSKGITDKLLYINENPGAVHNFTMQLDPKGSGFRDLKGKINVDESLYEAASAMGGLIRGNQSEMMLGYKNIWGEANKGGIANHLVDYLNLKAYERAYQNGMDRYNEATTNAKAAQQALGNPALSMRDRVKYEDAFKAAKKEAKDWANKIQSGKMVPDGKAMSDIRLDQQQLQQNLGPQKFGQVKGLADRVFGLNSNILELLHDNGILSDRDYQKYKARGPEYIPMTRIMTDLNERNGRYANSPSQKMMYLKNQSIIQEMEGSERVNMQPLASSAKMMNSAIAEAYRNKTVKSALQLWSNFPKELAGYYREVGSGYRPTVDEHIIGAYQNGIQKLYATPRWLGETLENAGAVNNDMAMNMGLSFAKNMLRSGATAGNLAYTFVRVTRDMPQAAIMSEGGAKNAWDIPGIAKFTSDWVANMQDRWKKTALWDEYNKSGVAFSGFQRSLTPEHWLSPEQLGFQGKMAKGRIIDNIQDFNAAVEDSIKYNVYKRMRLAGNSEIASAREARKYGGAPDYMKMGEYTQPMNLVAMFFNARLQDTLRVFDKAQENPMRVVAAMTALTAASLAIGQWNYSRTDSRGNRLIDKVSQQERNRNWVILLPYTYTNPVNGAEMPYKISVPKTDVHRLFVNPIEAAVDKAMGRDQRSGKQIALDLGSQYLPIGARLDANESAIKNVTRGVTSNLNPLARIPAEQMMNYNATTDAPIVPQREQGMDPSTQVGSQTSPLGRLMGQGGAKGAGVGATAGALTGYAFGGPMAAAAGSAIGAGLGASGVSPRRFDAAYGEATGGVGQSIGQLYRPLSGPNPKNPEGGEGLAGIRQVPVIGQIVNSLAGSQMDQQEQTLTQQFYRAAEPIQMRYSTFQKLEKSNPSEALQYQSAHQTEVFQGRLVDSMLKRLGVMQSNQRKIAQMQGITDTDRERYLRDYHDNILELLKTYNSYIDESGRAFESFKPSVSTQSGARP
jgi:GNAT superfamily N-acetyltransferase